MEGNEDAIGVGKRTLGAIFKWLKTGSRGYRVECCPEGRARRRISRCVLWKGHLDGLSEPHRALVALLQNEVILYTPYFITLL